MNKFIFINILLFSLISNLFAYGENKDLEKDSKIDKEKTKAQKGRVELWQF